jgi:trehalose 6-phosphate synthase/phosphatase
MLNSDLIGFHLFEYAKNFVTSCKKLLDLNYEFRKGGSLGIDVDGRRYVSLRIGHVGIEKECINEVITSQDFTRCFNQLFSKESKVKGKVFIAGVDYWHPMSGITNKFRAFYEFLKDNP